MCEELGWEFLKEKKKVNKIVNTHASTQKRTRSRKQALVHAKTQSYKKASTQKRTRTRKHARKHANTSASLRGHVRVFLPEFFFAWTLSCTSACFLERVLFCVDVCMFVWTRVCLRGRVHVFFLFSFIKSQPWRDVA